MSKELENTQTFYEEVEEYQSITKSFLQLD